MSWENSKVPTVHLGLTETLSRDSSGNFDEMLLDKRRGDVISRRKETIGVNQPEIAMESLRYVSHLLGGKMPRSQLHLILAPHALCRSWEKTCQELAETLATL